MRKKIALIIVFFFFSCSQEGLIFIRNYRRINFDIINQLLLDTGIITNSIEAKEKLQPDNFEKKDLPIVKKIPSENKIMRVSAGTTFTIKLPAETNFVVLKSIEGDTTFNSNNSKIDSGIYSFSAGVRDSKIKFDILDLEGTLKKRVAYYINITQKDTNIVSPAKVKEKSVTTNFQTNTLEKPKEIGIKGVIENIKNNLPYPEAVKEYERMMASEEITPEEKEIVKNELVELLLRRKDFEKAEKTIKEIENEGRKNLYNGWLNHLRKRSKEAYILYREALKKGDSDTKKITLSLVFELLKENKLATLEEVNDLENYVGGFKKDKDFYGKSMIDIAEIYIYFKKVYKSEEILKNIIEGDYNKELKERAKGLYKELREGFIEYR